MSIQLFQNQYLLCANQEAEKVDLTWNTYAFKDYKLFIHEGLGFHSIERGSSKLVLIGFGIHILHADWTEKDILANFPENENEFLDYLDHICGNFIVLYEKEGVLKSYNDAGGVLKMFVWKKDNQVLAMGLDPKILQHFFHIPESSDAEVQEFYTSEFFTKEKIRLGNISILQDVQQVMTNHSLNFKKGEVERFFPREKLKPLALNDAIDQLEQYTANIIKGALNKFQLRPFLTAGWDSRMVATFCKGHYDELIFSTFINPPYKKSHHDVRIPKRIAKRLKFEYRPETRELPLSEQEKENIINSFYWINEGNYTGLFGGFSKFQGQNIAFVNGSISEICKNYYGDVEVKNSEILNKAAHFPILKLTTKHFQERLLELKEIEKKYGYDLRDIAHWEQDITNFAGQGMLNRSPACITFSPFNARQVIHTMLRVDRKLRDKDHHQFFAAYIKAKCPEIKNIPINPTLKKTLIKTGKKLGIYTAYKNLSTQLRK